jgi:hypothetical protein
MKTQIFTILLLVIGNVFASVPVEKMVPVDYLYSPAGFDSNDNVEVVVTGFMPNLCHQTPEASVKFSNNGDIELEVTSLYYDKTNPFCPQMIVPFKLTVSLGLLDAGSYNIVANKNSNKRKAVKSTLIVTESISNAIDTYHYAYVTNVLDKTGSHTVKLTGYNPSDCFVLDKIESISNGKDTFSVLPKMKQINDFCPRKMVPFSYEFEVPKTLKKNAILIHVRTMQGKSINTILHQ